MSKLSIHNSAWAIILENAISWYKEYASDMGLGNDTTIDILYANRCNDIVNHMLKSPVSIDETLLLLDRFWAKENNKAKTKEFKDRVAQIADKYEDIEFEEYEEEEVLSEIVPEDSGQKPKNKEIYAYDTDVEFFSQHLYRLALKDDQGNTICKVLIDPDQALKLNDQLSECLKQPEVTFERAVV